MPIRARDLRTNIKEQGFEQGVVRTVELLLDEFAGLRQHMRELTELVSQCVDQISRLAEVGSRMKDTIDTIKRTGKQSDGDTTC